MMEKIVGRDPGCDIVIIDPSRRVSRRHLKLDKSGIRIQVTDLRSVNGTFINGKKISAHQAVGLHPGDRITLGLDLVFDYEKIDWDEGDMEATRILPSGKNTDGHQALLTGEPPMEKRKNQAILVDAERTSIGDYLSLSDIGFIRIGRVPDNTFVLDNPKVSREHCKLRLVSPELFEIVDLGSTNAPIAETPEIETHLIGHIFDATFIDSDGDGAVDYFDIQEVYEDGSFIHIEGSDGTGLESFDAANDAAAGLTYQVLLQDIDSDGIYDDGQWAVIDPAGNAVVFDSESDGLWDMDAQIAFAALDEYELQETPGIGDLPDVPSESDVYADIDWQSFSDRPSDFSAVGLSDTPGEDDTAFSTEPLEALSQTPDYVETESTLITKEDYGSIESYYTGSEDYQTDLYNTDFGSWEAPESFEF